MAVEITQKSTSVQTHTYMFLRILNLFQRNLLEYLTKKYKK